MLAEMILVAASASGMTAQPSADCALKEYEASFFRPDDQRVLPGATLRYRAEAGASHSGNRPIALTCLPAPELLDPVQGTVDAENGRIRLNKDLAPGDVVKLRYGDKQMHLIVNDPDNATISRLAPAKEVRGCNSERVGEIEFTYSGSFSVTFQPFERYKDYWGRYRRDGKTGDIVMTATGGNRLPPQMEMRGRLLKHEDDYYLSGVNLGRAQPLTIVNADGENRPSAKGCTYRF